MKRRRLGQHFLRSKRVINILLEEAEKLVKNPRLVVEIGGGRGVLTNALLSRFATSMVVSYELDEVLSREASNGLAGRSWRLGLINGDGFRVDVSRGFDLLVSSLPYSESRRFVEWLVRQRFKGGVVLLQREFANKLLARPGGSSYGAYSVISQIAFDMKLVVKSIPPNAFTPPPKVFSSVVVLKPRSALLRDKSPRLVKSLKLLFSFRNKVLEKVNRMLGVSVDDPRLLRKRVRDLSPEEALLIASSIRS